LCASSVQGKVTINEEETGEVPVVAVRDESCQRKGSSAGGETHSVFVMVSLYSLRCDEEEEGAERREDLARFEQCETHDCSTPPLVPSTNLVSSKAYTTPSVITTIA
jgi:hypothetical protein